MKIFSTIFEIKNEIKKSKLENKSIGFVPTMGFLHEGHLSLMRKASSENDITVISIFVNPTQFGPGEDLESYPRDMEKDISLAEAAGADILFAPSVLEMYPEGYTTYVNTEGKITKILCGKSRPGHFKGVTTIVCKLFNIIKPGKAYFGQKDAQQVAVIEKMARDLNLDVEIISCPIIREKDGLALSSRNSYLNAKERKDAAILSKSLLDAEKMILSGEKDALKIKEYIKNNINAVSSAEIDYIEIVDPKTLLKITDIKGAVLIALAVKIGNTRLIDNIKLEVQPI